MTDFSARSRTSYVCRGTTVLLVVLLFFLRGAAYSFNITPGGDVCTSETEGAGICVDQSTDQGDNLFERGSKGKTSPEAIQTGGNASAAGEEKTRARDVTTGSSPGKREVVVYFFWGKGCPHCEKEKTFFREIKKQIPYLTIKDFEVWYDKKNAALFSKMAEAYGIKTIGVPLTFIGENAFAGFSKQLQAEIEAAIRGCSAGDCSNPMDKVQEVRTPKGKPALRSPGVAGTPSPGNAGGGGGEEKRGNGRSEGPGKRRIVTVPLIGEIDPVRVSLPFVTIAIAGMDSFNPCAFFILFSLLGLLVYAQSRRKMFLIGSVFVFFSGLIYFLFMAAWLNLFLIMGQVAFITKVAGAVSVLIAAINIKDFFLFKKGLSLTIPDSAQPKLFDRMRRLMKSTSLVSILVGTSVLAIAANSYELLCTAGFPMVFTRILTLNTLPTVSYYLYLVLYNVIYVVPLALIVAVFSVSLGKRKLTEWQGRVLKLLSGTMMLGLGGVLFLDPALLNNILASVLLLAGSLVVTAVTAFLAGRVASRHSPAGPQSR